MYKDIVKLLCKSSHSVIMDKSTFERWKNKQITLEQAISDFKYNNYQEQSVFVDSRLFKDWVESLGYRQSV